MIPGPRELSTREIRALRPLDAARAGRDPWAPPPVLLETERLAAAAGGSPPVPALTLFLVGAECPFTCVFCDLWRHTLEAPTPPGALLAQLDAALAAYLGPAEEAEPGRTLSGTIVKLYNASNFFERRAVPAADREAIARRLAGALRVVVECHPRLVGAECFAFAEAVEGRLEVAMGLETVHPEAFPRLNKGMALEEFAAAAGRLRERGVAVRAFVQVGLPWVPPDQSVEWAVRSVEHAFVAGAENVAIIPTRGGNGAMEALAARGVFAPPSLADLEAALERSLGLAAARSGAVVTADVWDLAAFSSCGECLPPRSARLTRMNLSGTVEPRVACGACGG